MPDGWDTLLDPYGPNYNYIVAGTGPIKYSDAGQFQTPNEGDVRRVPLGDGRWVDLIWEDDGWRALGSSYWDRAGGSGGGGDPYAADYLAIAQGGLALDRDKFGLDRDRFEYSKTQDAIANEYNNAVLAQRKAEADAKYALSVGDLELARQRQSDANYWQGISAQIELERLALDARGQDMSYAAAMAQVEAQKYASDQRFQADMANATNDQQRNMIIARWNQEQAAIARMQDETNRILGGQQNQIAQFGAETARAVGMGNLALENNKFIADMASGARGADLFSLYFMQRGIAPDFNTMAAGGTPATGASLVPANVMNAYTPVTAPVQFNGTPQNSQMAAVGQATAAGVSAAQQPNRFIGASMAASSSGGGGGGFTPSPYTPRNIDISGPPKVAQPPPPMATPYSGVPNAAVYGMNPGDRREVTTGTLGESHASDYKGFRVYDQNGNLLTGTIAPGQRVTLERLALGGWTTGNEKGEFIVGDAAHPTNPQAGGAVPEVVQLGMKDGKPAARVIPNLQNLINYGVVPLRSTAAVTMGPEGMVRQPLLAREQPSWLTGAPVRQPMQQQPLRWQGAPPMARAQTNYGVSAPQQVPSGVAMMRARMPRFALGTDNSALYAAMGMGDSWIPESGNTYANSGPAPMPTRMAALANYGFPVSPTLYQASTGQTLNTNNLAGAFTTGRQAGTLASLQTINNMDDNEREMYKGYVEGVAKTPWRSVINYLAAATRGLGSAQRARVA